MLKTTVDFTGLILFSGLVVFVCVLSDECGPNPIYDKAKLTHPPKDEDGLTAHRHSFDSGYSYGWSFLMAAMAFLAAEASAAFCLTAFLNKFETEVLLL